MAALRSPKPLVKVRVLQGMPNNGNVVEWSMALVLKTSESKGSVSSNLTVSAKIIVSCPRGLRAHLGKVMVVKTALGFESLTHCQSLNPFAV
jgi:hypothetical protein